LIHSIPLSDCLNVFQKRTEIGEPLTFHLETIDRVYMLQPPTVDDMRSWIRCLKTFIDIQAVKDDKKFIHVKEIMFHILRILHGTIVLRNIDDTVKDKIEIFEDVTCAFLEDFTNAAKNKDNDEAYDIRETTEKMLLALMELKLSIPLTHRIRPEEITFNYNLEESRIKWHIEKIITKNRDLDDPINIYIVYQGCNCINN